MRISILLLNDTYFSNIEFRQNYNSLNFILQLIIFFVIVFGFYSSTVAQWVNNPKTNTKLVIDTNNPVNITSVRDYNGGAFIFWQDNKKDSISQVYFIHVDANGKVSMRADGKNVSTLNGAKENPVSSVSLSNSAVVTWKDFSTNRFGNLFAQRVSSNGDYLWNEKGIQLTNDNYNIYDYSITSDTKGNVFISYVTNVPGIQNNYKVESLKITPGGKFGFDSTVTITKSQNRESMSKVVSDNTGGCYIFWIENQKIKSVLFVQHINKQGKVDWVKTPIRLSDENLNVINYTVNRIDSSSVYVAWQMFKKGKEIYHQLINYKGSLLWGDNGKLIASQKGNQINPQAVTGDSSIILSWTYELKNDQNVYIQKFNLSGEPLWNLNGEPVIKLNRAQFGQRTISDGKSGALVSWYDRRKDSTLANIYSQRINSQDNRLWNSLGVELFANDNSPKSYLSLVPDESGGAVAIIKEKLNGKNEIYGQRIYDSGTFGSQLTDFNSELLGDSVKLSWYSSYELSNEKFNIQRSIESDSISIPFQIIATVSEGNNTDSTYFEYYDKPEIPGTISYRITEVDSSGSSQTSETQKINYTQKSGSFKLEQNNPNPFSDSTRISFFLPVKSDVTFEFYNSHLDSVKNINKNYPAGQNHIIFSANGLEAGVYFYRMKVDGFIDVRKMVITK